MLRDYDPSSPTSACTRVVDDVHRLLLGRKVVGWHCTRLTADEATDILENGLRALSYQHTRKRLSERVAAGELSNSEATFLLRRVERRAEDEWRGGRIWAVLSRDALDDERGLENSFRYWGGEVLLALDDWTSEALARIGSSCIVEFQTLADGVRCSHLGQCFVERFLRDELGRSDGDSGDLCLTGSVSASDIRRVIRRTDPDFERLTECSRWDRPLE